MYILNLCTLLPWYRFQCALFCVFLQLTLSLPHFCFSFLYIRILDPSSLYRHFDQQNHSGPSHCSKRCTNSLQPSKLQMLLSLPLNHTLLTICGFSWNSIFSRSTKTLILIWIMIPYDRTNLKPNHIHVALHSLFWVVPQTAARLTQHFSWRGNWNGQFVPSC